MSNYYNNKKYGFNNTSKSSKKDTQNGTKSPVEDEENTFIDIMPAISRTFSPIGINIEFSQANRFSKRKPEHNWQSCEASSSTNGHLGQHDTSYYQHQPANYN